jgi:hypothetical protein
MALSTFYFKKAIEKFGEAYIKELANQLIKAKKKATGELIESLDYQLVEASNEIILRIIANAYLIDVDQGRKKGDKRIDPSLLTKWAKIKKIGLTFGKIKYKTIMLKYAINGYPNPNKTPNVIKIDASSKIKTDSLR